jgi:nucleotide-binding universal stress UspA family protein
MYQRILFGYDASMRTDTHLSHIVRIAQASQSDVLLVHCVVPPGFDPALSPTDSDGTGLAVGSTDHAVAFQRAGSIRQLSVSAESLRASGLRSVQTVVVEGPTAEVIIAVAREHRSDLIVLGDSGRSIYDAMRLGAVAEAVLLLSPCPVLVLRSARNGL